MSSESSDQSLHFSSTKPPRLTKSGNFKKWTRDLILFLEITTIESAKLAIIVKTNVAEEVFDFDKLRSSTKVEDAEGEDARCLDPNVKLPTVGLLYLFNELYKKFTPDAHLRYASLLSQITRFKQESSEHVLKAFDRFQLLVTEFKTGKGNIPEDQLCIHFLDGVNLSRNECIMMRNHLCHMYKIVKPSEYELEKLKNVLELMFQLDSDIPSGEINQVKGGKGYTQHQSTPSNSFPSFFRYRHQGYQGNNRFQSRFSRSYSPTPYRSKGKGKSQNHSKGKGKGSGKGRFSHYSRRRFSHSPPRSRYQSRSPSPYYSPGTRKGQGKGGKGFKGKGKGKNQVYQTIDTRRPESHTDNVCSFSCGMMRDEVFAIKNAYRDNTFRTKTNINAIVDTACTTPVTSEKWLQEYEDLGRERTRTVPRSSHLEVYSQIHFCEWQIATCWVLRTDCSLCRSETHVHHGTRLSRYEYRTPIVPHRYSDFRIEPQLRQQHGLVEEARYSRMSLGIHLCRSPVHSNFLESRPSMDIHCQCEYDSSRRGTRRSQLRYGFLWGRARNHSYEWSLQSVFRPSIRSSARYQRRSYPDQTLQYSWCSDHSENPFTVRTLFPRTPVSHHEISQTTWLSHSPSRLWCSQEMSCVHGHKTETQINEGRRSSSQWPERIGIYWFNIPALSQP